MANQPGYADNEALNARIEVAMAEANLGRMLAEEGITTVALDSAGRLVEYRPDGSSTILD